jgi:hypothetical protein
MPDRYADNDHSAPPTDGTCPSTRSTARPSSGADSLGRYAADARAWAADGCATHEMEWWV